MHASQAPRLTEHARRRHQETLQRAEQTLAQLTDTAQPVTVASLANRAGVSRSWIYTQPALRDKIRQRQQDRTTADHSRDIVTRSSDESLRRRLALAHERINQLRTENQELRDALAHAHGQLRAARHNAGTH